MGLGGEEGEEEGGAGPAEAGGEKRRQAQMGLGGEAGERTAGQVGEEESVEAAQLGIACPQLPAPTPSIEGAPPTQSARQARTIPEGNFVITAAELKLYAQAVWTVPPSGKLSPQCYTCYRQELTENRVGGSKKGLRYYCISVSAELRMIVIPALNNHYSYVHRWCHQIGFQRNCRN